MSPLPEFNRPPIDEVAIGIQFEPLVNFHAVHFGAYWHHVREQYPLAEDQPPLAPQIENEPVVQQAQIMFRTGLFLPRCWFLKDSGTELIQVQQDRFHRNWRRIKGDEPYPRFEYLVERFKSDWQGFVAFVARESLGPVKVNHCELTYINHLEPGVGWKDYSQLANVFSMLRAPQGGFLPDAELFSWESRYKLQDGKGRLHINAQPAMRSRDFKMILMLSLTSRGAPENGTEEAMFSWFALAHEWIVRGFDQVTQPTMHALWEKK